jgi:hypothetical protein
MNKITKALDELSDDELFEFEKDLKSGTIQRFLDQKKEYFRIREKTCSTCGNSVDEDCLVLIFGDPKIGVRKKAHFCGLDCLEYFINKNVKKDTAKPSENATVKNKKDKS